MMILGFVGLGFMANLACLLMISEREKQKDRKYRCRAKMSGANCVINMSGARRRSYVQPVYKIVSIRTSRGAQ
jgi:hypothetical protein